MKVDCINCKMPFSKFPSQMRSKKGNNFCSRSCATIYNNKNKEQGERRSKIEIWLQQRITETFPDLKVHYNRKDSGIGSELDIYIPSLKLGIEIHGRAHYEPIYGPEILIAKQNMDQEKRERCKANMIELVEVDASKLKDFKRSMELVRIVETVLGTIKDRLTLRPEA